MEFNLCLCLCESRCTFPVNRLTRGPSAKCLHLTHCTVKPHSNLSTLDSVVAWIHPDSPDAPTPHFGQRNVFLASIILDLGNSNPILSAPKNGSFVLLPLYCVEIEKTIELVLGLHPDNPACLTNVVTDTRVHPPTPPYKPNTCERPILCTTRLARTETYMAGPSAGCFLLLDIPSGHSTVSRPSSQVYTFFTWIAVPLRSRSDCIGPHVVSSVGWNVARFSSNIKISRSPLDHTHSLPSELFNEALIRRKYR
ncbi:hypothetical protein FS749_001791 [Ceratobasidium sp. UAMH 11750]|nr:hypothetical protein FS749_001791 [Ceratobasidium sp. UAMH 11750]